MKPLFMTKHIPNFITSLNLVSGFVSIIFALNGQPVTASWLILAAMVFDFLDGFSARLLKAYSDIGKELDSLADVVSFGVAPAIIIYQILYNQQSINGPGVAGFEGGKQILLFTGTFRNGYLCCTASCCFQCRHNPGNHFQGHAHTS